MYRDHEKTKVQSPKSKRVLSEKCPKVVERGVRSEIRRIAVSRSPPVCGSPRDHHARMLKVGLAFPESPKTMEK